MDLRKIRVLQQFQPYAAPLLGSRCYRYFHRYADPSAWLKRPYRWTLAMWSALLLMHLVSPAQAAKKQSKKEEATVVSNTVVEYGAPDAPYHLTIFGDLGCPEGTPNMADWWKALQDPEIAELTRVSYHHAPKKASKNTKVAAQSAFVTQTKSSALFLEMAAQVCEIVRAKPKTKLKKAQLAKEAAKMGLPQKEFGKAYKKNKKAARKAVQADEKYGAAHFSKPGAPLYLVNDAATPFPDALAFKTWVLAQQKAKAEAAEAAQAAQEPALPNLLQIAVYDIVATDIPAAVAPVVTDALTAELRKMTRASVISMEEVRQMLSYEADKKVMGCDADSCLTEIAEALGVDVVVTGSLSSVGDKSYVTFKRIEQQAGKVSQQYSKTLDQAGGEEFLAILGDAVATLFPERNPRDGQERGVDAAMVARLNPPPLAPIWFWTGGALTSTALVAAGVAGASTITQYMEFDAHRSGQKGTPVDGSALGTLKEGTERWQMYTWGTLAAAGALGAMTGVIAAFTNWDGETLDSVGR